MDIKRINAILNRAGLLTKKDMEQIRAVEQSSIQSSCEYCANVKGEPNEHVEGKLYHGRMTLIQGNVLNVIEDASWAEVDRAQDHFTINYCPMCGRKL